MKVMCITDNQVGDQKRPGRFKRYEAGRVYEISKLNRHFRMATAEEKKAFEEKAAAYDKKIAERKPGRAKAGKVGKGNDSV